MSMFKTVLIFVLGVKLCHGRFDNYTELGVLLMEPFIKGFDDPICYEGRRQSPINMNRCCPVKMPALKWIDYEERAEGYEMVNSGHTVEIYFKGPQPAIIKGGPLADNYTLSHLHFHWGKTNEIGSGHSIDGKFTAMEAHFVHFKSSYGSLTEAVQHSDGIAVLGIFFGLTLKDNERLSPITDNLYKIKTPFSRTLLPSNALPGVPRRFSDSKFVSYSGSLTTSPCHEIVTWIVLNTTVGISARQVEKFRELLNTESEHIKEYRRETQPGNGRKITCSM